MRKELCIAKMFTIIQESIMENKINLDKLETKVFKTTYQDGLLDMFLGIILLQLAIGPLLTDIGFSDFGAAAAFIPVWLIALLLFFLIKRFITKPRIGTIKPGPVRKAKIVKVNILLLVILSAGFIIALLYEDFSQSINFSFPLTFSMMILSLASVSAYYFNIIRLYYYGILIAIAPLIGEILWSYGLVSHHGFPIVFGISSFVLITVGVNLFIRFLHNYPKIKMES